MSEQEPRQPAGRIAQDLERLQGLAEDGRIAAEKNGDLDTAVVYTVLGAALSAALYIAVTIAY